MSIYISGLGVLGIFGKGKEALLNAVENCKYTNTYDSLEVDIKAVKDKKLSAKMRRADRFTKMAVYSAGNAIEDFGPENLDPENTGIILTTAFGPHNTTFAFIDDLITYDEKNVSPIKFSHSVHNAAASYTAQLFNIKGPVSTVSQFKFPVQNAFILAKCWLENDLCEDVIVCCIDEKGSVFDSAIKQKINIDESNSLKPVTFSENAKAVPAEGAVSFILTKTRKKNSYCTIEDIKLNSTVVENTDLIIAGADGIPKNQVPYSVLYKLEIPVAIFNPVYGSILTGSAFDIATACLLLKDSFNYKNYCVTDNLNVQPAKSVSCIKSDCIGNISSIDFKASHF